MSFRAVLATAVVLVLSAGCTLTDERAVVEEVALLDLEARETERGLVITLPTLFFQFNEAFLTLEARRKIHEVADILNGSTAQDLSISVEGHADSIGSRAYNLDLSLRRAQAVAEELVFSNVRRDRITVRGLGESTPLAPNSTPGGADNPQGRALNRRVEIVLAGPEQ